MCAMERGAGSLHVRLLLSASLSELGTVLRFSVNGFKPYCMEMYGLYINVIAGSKR